MKNITVELLISEFRSSVGKPADADAIQDLIINSNFFPKLSEKWGFERFDKNFRDFLLETLAEQTIAPFLAINLHKEDSILGYCFLDKNQYTEELRALFSEHDFTLELKSKTWAHSELLICHFIIWT